MSEDVATSTALAHREEQSREMAIMSDDEIRRTYRIAEALWQSGAFDVKKAEAAFAKIVIGRDLGLTPAQSMSGIHLVEGGVSMHYSTLGQFVRSREGYDYRSGWIKAEHRADPDGDPDREMPLVAVYHDEEEIADVREIVGAFVEFVVDGERRGISRFTVDDADAAGLIKRDKPKSAWMAARRNMLLARAMSNGVKWFVPEILGGMPVYAPGELPEQKPELTEGTEATEPQGVELGPDVEKIIAKAEALGHRGLSNRAAIELAVGGRAPGLVADWVRRAKDELKRFEAEKANADPETGEVKPDTETQPAEVEVAAPPEEVDAEPVMPDPPDVPDVKPENDEKVVTTAADEVRRGAPTTEAAVPLDEETQVLAHRFEALLAVDPESLGDSERDDLFAEMDRVEAQLKEKGVEVER
jgi:hypothetical protein